MEKWYRSAHSRIISIIEVSVITFVITGSVLFLLLYIPTDFFMEESIMLHKPLLYFIISVAAILSMLATIFVVSGGLYKVKFSEQGIEVRTRMYGRRRAFDIPYSDIQFIQIYTEKSSVRNRPKAIIVVKENSKYELMLIEDKEGDYIMNLVPAELVKKIM